MGIEYRAIVENGQIKLTTDDILPDGTELIITVMNSEALGITVEELLKTHFIGEWADRDDIGDTAEYADKLRQQAQKRNYDNR